MRVQGRKEVSRRAIRWAHKSKKKLMRRAADEKGKQKHSFNLAGEGNYVMGNSGRACDGGVLQDCPAHDSDEGPSISREIKRVRSLV